MGYTTNFNGKFKFNRQLSLDEYRELKDISERDWRDKPEGESNSYYCQWTPTEDGWYLQWDECEKFYGYIEWLKWLIITFFEPKGISLNGEVGWDGEEQGDMGKILVKDNKVEVKQAKIIFD